MQINHIESGHSVMIYVGEDKGVELEARYIESVDNQLFLVNNMQIYDNIDDYLNQPVLVVFTVRDNLYQAECRIIGRGGKRRIYDTVIVEAPSGGFKEETRRTTVRFAIKVKVKIYEFIDDNEISYKGGYICDAMSVDISRGGMRVSTNYQLTQPHGTLFSLEFAITYDPRALAYTVPSKLVMSRRASSAFASAYEYGFQFDVEKMPELQEKLILDIFNLKLTQTRN